MTKISIIIPNYNGTQYLPSCLRTLSQAIKQCPNSQFEIILVDNASTDNSPDIFDEFKFPKIKSSESKIIFLKKNFGFATAVNHGIKVARYKYVCLLNNDVNLDKNYFKLIVQNIKKNPKISCFCGTVLNYNGTKVESQGISFDWSGKCLQNQHHPPGLIWGASGAAVIYQKNIVKHLGLFDEKYFAYIEDVDLAFRLQKNNYQTLFIPTAIAYHLGGGTSNRMGNFRAKQIFKNWFYFILKNYSKKEILTNLPQIILERLRNFSYLIKSSINK